MSAVVDRLAESIAREALSDRTFRRSIREIVRRRSAELLDGMFQNGNPQQQRMSPTRQRSVRR